MATAPVGNHFDIGTLKFWALGDRLLIQEDEFKTGYECTSCDGKCKVACPQCQGTGTYKKEGSDVEFKCGQCSDGQVICPDCQGKGGILIAPDTAQRRPTTGTIVSVGPRCEHLKVGDKVMYSNFAGYTVDLKRAGEPVCLRILHESEILCQMDGHLDLKTVTNKSDISTFAP